MSYAFENDFIVLLSAGFFPLHRCGASWFGKCIGSDDHHAVCMVSVPCKLHHGYGSFYPGHPRDLLGVSIDLEY